MKVFSAGEPRAPCQRSRVRDGGIGFVTAECPNLDEFLFLPVSAGMWRQHELWDGTYTLDDLLDIVELIRVKHENEYRAWRR